MGASQSTQHPHVLETSKGKLQGLESRTPSGTPIMYRYAKIPYAHPPIGELRWQRPKPLSTSFTFNDQHGQPGDYTKFGPICPQPVYNTKAALLDNPEAAPEIENVEDEDCLYLNIWVPAGTAPEKGWPVQFFIHGGWLQVNDANQSTAYDPVDLLATSTKRIIVAPTYRLNMFGFAAGEDLASLIDEPFAGNFGFWDQRLALEWTHSNITLFKGNPELITVGGLSAGAHSTFMQLYYDTYLPTERQIIKQVFMYSNALAIQPNPTKSPLLTEQFSSICEALGIDSSLSPKEKLAKLRATSWEDLRDTIPKLKYHTFRASTDGPIKQGGFVPPTFLSSLHDGSFTTKLAKRGTRLLFGEVRDEGELYKLVNPPSNYDGLIVQLSNYYPRPVVEALVALPQYNVPQRDDPNATEDQWVDVFARMTADGQVHASIRGLAKCLLDPAKAEGVTPVPADRVFRYKICWRAKGLDKWLKPECGLCHASDTPIWWASGYRADFLEDDKRKNEAFIGTFGRFLEGEKDIGWGGTGEVDELLLLDEDGHIQQGFKDDQWQRCLNVWNAIWEAQKDTIQHV